MNGLNESLITALLIPSLVTLTLINIILFGMVLGK